MNIILVITCLNVGGAEKQVCDLADRFSSLGHKVSIISMTGKASCVPKSNDVRVFNLNMSKNPIQFMISYWVARKYIIDNEPDVVHSHMVHANIFCRLLRLTVYFPKLICSAHSSNEGGWFRMLAYKYTDFLCDLTTNVSQDAVISSINRGAVSSRRIITMYNGIDVETFSFNEKSRIEIRNGLGLSDDVHLLLAVGRLTVAKDYPNLLTAFEVVASRIEHVQLAIIGAGEEKQVLEELVSKSKFKSRIHLLGLRYNINDWMSAADLFVLSSAWEGFGLVVAEAMACERIVVATDCGGVKEVLADNGIIVPPKNSEALAVAITNGLSLDPLVSKELGSKAREHIVRKFSLSSIAEKWVDIYKNR